MIEVVPEKLCQDIKDLGKIAKAVIVQGIFKIFFYFHLNIYVLNKVRPAGIVNRSVMTPTGSKPNQFLCLKKKHFQKLKIRGNVFSGKVIVFNESTKANI